MAPTINPTKGNNIMQITLNSLSDYNAGRLIWKTFDLSGMDKEDYLLAISNWLASVDVKRGDGEVREEWNVADIEDIPHNFVGDYDLDDAFWEYKEALEASDLDAEVFAAAMAAGINIDRVEDSYRGQWDTDFDFAVDWFNEVCMHDVPDFLVGYIDYEAYARDLMDEFTESGGHYFYNC